MTSKFQKLPFPVELLGKSLSLTVKAQSGDTVEIKYQDLKLVIINNQLCYLYESEDGDLLMPIARKSTIKKLFGIKEV